MVIAKDEIIALINAFHDTVMYQKGDAEALRPDDGEGQVFLQ